MIESISLHKEATFNTRQSLERLSQINLVYGSNGTGKTTISRVIDDVDRFDRCGMRWRNGTPLETFVYNREFIENHFDQSGDLPGVFTLGNDSVEIKKQIDALREEIAQIDDRIANRLRQLDGDKEQEHDGKREELNKLETELEKNCWKQKLKHDDYFKDAFKGYRGTQAKFCDKVLSVWPNEPNVTETLEKLKRDAETVFGDAPTPVQILKPIDASQVCKYEGHQLLHKSIRGKEDVSLAELIEEIGHSDWVREGVDYHADADGKCPFCQRDTEEGFAETLGEYFDETFEKEKRNLETMCSRYETASSKMCEELDQISQGSHQFLDVEKFEMRANALKSKFDLNIGRLEGKRNAPSTTTELESVGELVAELNEQLRAVNDEARNHNDKISNLKQERTNLTKRVWQYIVHDELQTTLETHRERSDGLDQAITNMESDIREKRKAKEKLEEEIRNLEGQITGTRETLETINELLERFTFISFKLSQADDERGYRLVRHDGSDASQTLSEGEKTFVTFLYFYNLLKGSLDKAGVTNNRVVVLDDPVSSLDSDVLFIVSTLIRTLFNDVQEEQGNIKQIFVLTHNTYCNRSVG